MPSFLASGLSKISYGEIKFLNLKFISISLSLNLLSNFMFTSLQSFIFVDLFFH